MSAIKAFRWILVTSLIIALGPTLGAADKKSEKEEKSNPLATLSLRSLGPAITSGRISDFAFHPDRPQEFYVATASGNLWKTNNNAITWTPIFDNEGSYAIGVVEMDPSDPLRLWVGTGENNAQRSVAYGDGVYKSIDGGQSWKNMGLGDSGHISQIWIDPADSNTVLVAAQGPLWNSGGDRGLYRTRDGGETWKKILGVDEHTGINEFVVDPRNPDTIVASSYQRRRHVWVLINGGPGSGIHKTTDGGETWREITSGLPSSPMGRIGLAGAPSNPNLLYSIIEGAKDDQGVYRSLDFGENWEKRSGHMTSSPQYYNELVVDPLNEDRVYSMDTLAHVSEDGGKSFHRLSIEHRHVDDHALWIDPRETDHLYIGGDGGIYESWDQGQTWRHVRNLSIAQFYRIQPDNEFPFYNVCGGTQDNNSLCAPSRTTVVHGITNSDWTIVLGGDGYKPQIDPEDPNTIYAQYQYGGLTRYDRRTQERVPLTPHPGAEENAYKWNWNSPLLISPHHPHRLYYGAEKLFQSDDRGNSWRAISPDLTRQLDRNQLKVMGRVWSVDSVAKNNSTSKYGSLIGIAESPLQEGLLYVGSDDGLISVSEDGGENWHTVKSFRGVPDMAYVDDIIASQHDPNVAYAAVDNHKKGDYKPYVIKTTDKGKSWVRISGDLPERGSTHTIAEDHKDPNLLFVGTEFGVFFTQDAGLHWSQLNNGIPTIAVRDMEIQRRESDLVVGTFGRGIYILDDYSPLRTPKASLEQSEATLFPVKDPWLYVEGDLWDSQVKGSQGAAFFNAPNPTFGAIATYYLKEEIKSLKAKRREAESEIEEKGGDTPYPSWDELRQEDREEAPSVFLVIRDGEGNPIRQVKAASGQGLHRVAWDLRLPAPDPVDLTPPGFKLPWASTPKGPLALPGTYSITLAKRQGGEFVELSEPQSFEVKSLERSPETTSDRPELLKFQDAVGELARAVYGASGVVGEMQSRIDHLKAAVVDTPSATEQHAQTVRALEARLADLKVSLSGDSTIFSRNEAVPWSLSTRAANLHYSVLDFQSDVPDFYRDSYAIATGQLEVLLQSLESIEKDLIDFEAEMEALGAPWTPGRIPQWKAEN